MDERAPLKQRHARSQPHQTSSLVLVAYVVGGVVCAVGNAVTFKKMLDSYKSHDGRNPHNYEFFVNQFNLSLYVLLALSIVLVKCCGPGGRLWLAQQEISQQQMVVMACLDALAGFLAAIGGAYTGGAVQNLINQCIIPLTLLMSKLFLNSVYTIPQQMGAYTILLGTIIAIVPTFRKRDDGVGGTTVTGALIFFSSVLPAAFSNVYKEFSFRTTTHADVYFLTTVVSSLQVLLGFVFVPILALPSFGGTAIQDVPLQFKQGFMCFLGMNSQVGDKCNGEPTNMLSYVIVNFLLNIVSLLVTKHGSAALVVVSSALALPLTNLVFSSKALLGEDAEPLSKYNLVALVLVVLGFIAYSLLGREDAQGLPVQAAGGSLVYVPPGRAQSAPSTPAHTPQAKMITHRRTPLQSSGPLALNPSARGSYTPLQDPRIPQNDDQGENQLARSF